MILGTVNNNMIIEDRKQVKAKKSDNLFDGAMCSKNKVMAKTIPTKHLALKGFKATPYPNGFKLKANRRVTAKLQNVDGKEYVKKILMECFDEECELRKETNDPIWDIEQVALNSFVIRKR